MNLLLGIGCLVVNLIVCGSEFDLYYPKKNLKSCVLASLYIWFLRGSVILNFRHVENVENGENGENVENVENVKNVENV